MGSSGGGGSSGAVSHSAYLETVHQNWLNRTGMDTMTDSITSAMDTAVGASPWIGKAAYNPDVPIAAYEAVLTAFKAILSGIVDTTNWNALWTQSKLSIGVPSTLVAADIVVAAAVAPASAAVADALDSTDVVGITDAEILADVTAFSDQLDDEITTKVLPRFRRGMQDINAVVSSAFPIGQAVIEAFRDRDVAKHNSTLRLEAATKNADIRVTNEHEHTSIKSINLTKGTQIAIANLNKELEIVKINKEKDFNVAKTNLAKTVDVGKALLNQEAEFAKLHLEGAGQMLRLLLQRVSFEAEYARMSVEANRIKIVAKKEQTDQDDTIDEQDALWNLEVFQYGANVMAGIAGGTSGNKMKSPSKTASVIGGAMAGAGAGAMIGAEVGSVGGPWGAAIGAVVGAAAAWLSS